MLRARESEANMNVSPAKAIENQSITWRLIAGLAVAVLVVSVAALTAMNHVVSEDATRNLERKADETLAYLVGSLEMPLWQVDQMEVKTIGMAVANDQSIVQLVVRNEFGTIIYSFARSQAGDLTNRSGKIVHKQGDEENLVGEISVSLVLRSEE